MNQDNSKNNPQSMQNSQKYKPFFDMVDEKLVVNLHSGQKKVLGSNKQIIAMLCGSQSGKTRFSAYWMYKEILRWDKIMQRKEGADDAIAWAVSPSHPLQREKLLPSFKNFFMEIMNIGEFRASDKVIEVTITRDDGTKAMYPINFKSADGTLESATVFAMVCDEAGLDDFEEESWEACIARTGTTEKSGGGRILITTSLYNFNWLKHEVYDKWVEGDPDIDVIQFDSLMNPNFSEKIWNSEKKRLPQWRFDLRYRGIFTRPGGMIYQDFDRSCIVEPFEIPMSVYRYVGVDPGLVSHSTVFFAQIHPNEEIYNVFKRADGISPVYVLYDSSLTGSIDTTMTNKEHAELLVSREDFAMLKNACGGSASEIYFREDYRVSGIEIIEPPFKEVSAGIDIVSNLLKEGKLYVFSDQKRIIKEFEEYSYRLDRDGNVVPIIKNKESFHGLDSIRYACMGFENANNHTTSSFLSVSGRSLLDI